MPHLIPCLAGAPFMGTPTEYVLHSDDYVAGLIVLCFMCLAFFIADTRKTIETSLLNTFQNVSRSKHFVKRLGDELNATFMLMVQVCLIEGTLLYAFLRHKTPTLFEDTHSMLGLCYCMAGILLFQCLRMFIYRVVNHTFFTPKAISEWAESHLLSLLFEAVLFYPLLVVFVFANLTIETFQILFILLCFSIELYRFTRFKVIFFPGVMGYLHIFLYFCMLNLAIPFLAYQILGKIGQFP
jgi:hypothetical protein